MLNSKLLRALLGLYILLIVFANGSQAIRQSKQLSNAAMLRERADGAQSVQNKTTLTPQFFLDEGSQRVQVSYGPFVVPNMEIANGMEDFELRPVDIGCKNCTIIYMEAGLQYPNGTYANANTSLWLHHVVLYNRNNLDTVCGDNEPGERFFASGNERDPTNISMNGTNKAGYYVGANDTILFLTELMNEAMVNQTAVVTITFEYVPGLPAGFSKVTPVWLDIGPCGGDSVMPAFNETTFQYTSIPWIANATGRITCAIGHLHDGGTHLNILDNNVTICDAVAAYGQIPGYVDPPGDPMDNMAGMSSAMMANMGKHISSISECSTGQVNLGDNLTVTAYYNTTEYMPMMDTDGTLAPIMGIALLYVAQNETYTAPPTSTATTAASTSSSIAAAATNVAGGSLWYAGALGGMVVLAFA